MIICKYSKCMIIILYNMMYKIKIKSAKTTTKN